MTTVQKVLMYAVINQNNRSRPIIIISFVLSEFSYPILRIFTDDKNVITKAESVKYFACLFMLLDSYQCLGNGLLRGIGKQTLGVPCVIIGGWIIGVPFSALFAFHFNCGLLGVWYGLVQYFNILMKSF